MSARIVFVHGIGGRRDVEKELARWVEALAEGACDAGHSRFARNLTDGPAVDVRLAYYGDLFSSVQAKRSGPLDLDEEEAEMLTAFLLDVIDEHCDPGKADSDAANSDGANPDGANPDGADSDDEDPDDTPPDAETLRILERARSQLAPTGQPQGAPDLVRRALNAATTLLGVPPLRKGGQWLVNQALVGDFAQVARYLARGERDASGRTLDERIRERVADAVGTDGGAVVIAHSLGSVVTFEALHEQQTAIPLLVTIGSPIGTRTIVRPRLRPQPPRTPESVGAWLNFWDKDDVIVARPRLEKGVAANSSGIAPVSKRVDSDGLWVHSAVKYLRRADVAGPVAEAVEALTGPHGDG